MSNFCVFFELIFVTVLGVRRKAMLVKEMSVNQHSVANRAQAKNGNVSLIQLGKSVAFQVPAIMATMETQKSILRILAGLLI